MIIFLGLARPISSRLSLTGLNGRTAWLKRASSAKPTGLFKVLGPATPQLIASSILFQGWVEELVYE
jgi:hypothetical protein